MLEEEKERYLGCCIKEGDEDAYIIPPLCTQPNLKSANTFGAERRGKEIILKLDGKMCTCMCRNDRPLLLLPRTLGGGFDER